MERRHRCDRPRSAPTCTRGAWGRFGIRLEDTDEPVDIPLGPTPIRLDPNGRGEVVWCDRFSPALARVLSVPMAESGVAYGDVLLHDGEPRGKRLLQGKERSVFDVLRVQERSRFSTFALEVEVDDEAAIERVFRLADELGFGFEDWTTSVRPLCRACSLGLPHDEHARDAPRSAPRRLAIAATSADEVESFAEHVDATVEGLGIVDVFLELDRTVRKAADAGV